MKRQHGKPDGIAYQRGKLPVEKGPALNMRVWQNIHRCEEDCPARDLCTYDKENLAQCQVAADYLKDIYYMLTRRADSARVLDERRSTAIGIMLIPMYSQLIRLLIAEFGVTHVTYTTDKGSIMINPIFKEIRATIKDIHGLEKSLFEEAITKVADPHACHPEMDTRIMGSPGYYQAVKDGTKPPREVYTALMRDSRTRDDQ